MKEKPQCSQHCRSRWLSPPQFGADISIPLIGLIQCSVLRETNRETSLVRDLQSSSQVLYPLSPSALCGPHLVLEEEFIWAANLILKCFSLGQEGTEQMKSMKKENKTNKSKEMKEEVKGLLLASLWLRKQQIAVFSKCEEKSHNQIFKSADSWDNCRFNVGWDESLGRSPSK